MRIAVLCDPELGNSNYRAYQPMQAIARDGRHELLVARDGKPMRMDTILSADAIHIHRIAVPQLQQVVRAAREAGIGVVWDNDDDVTQVPRSNPLYAKHGGFNSRERRSAVSVMMRLAHVVTTPSALLAEQYRELGAQDARVLENFVPTAFDRVRPQKHPGVVIAYSAALEHQVDYQQLGLRDTLQRLLDEHRDLRVLSLGLGLGLPADRYEHTKLVPFLELARALSYADIGIAPLVDIPWNRARSNVKLKEYASAGLPWLASPVGPYVGMGEEQGGRLVAEGDWHDALQRLVVDARERRKLGKRAAKWVKGEGIERHAHRWEEALRDAVARARAGAGAGATEAAHA